jgi:predicted permease
VRYALRSFARAPGFTTAALVTLALGIGAATAVFSLADGVLFRPLRSLAQAEDLALVQPCAPPTSRDSCPNFGLTYPNLREVVPRLRMISGLAAYIRSGTVELLEEEGAPRTVRPLYVTASYFDVLRTQPVLGRAFTEEEEDPSGGAPVVVISHRLWRALFNGVPEVLGQDLRVNERRLTVIGVMPRSFHGVQLSSFDLWLPASTLLWINRSSGDLSDRGSGGADFRQFIVRREPGVRWEEVKAELDSFNVWLAEQYPAENQHLGNVTFRISPDFLDRWAQASGMFMALFSVVGLIMLIACSNVAGLLVIKGLRRRGEVAVRKALGASRSRLLRQHLTEGLILWLGGGAAGTLLTFTLVRVAEARAPMSELEFPMDLRVLAFTAMLSLVVGLTFAALPALGAARVDAATWLGQASPSASGGRRWVRSGLSVAQLAATLTLLVGALLMARTVKGLSDIDLGFEPADVLVVQVRLGEQRPTDASRLQFYEEMARRLRADGRVIHASWALMIPFTSGGLMAPAIVAGEDESAAKEGRMTYVGPGYFEVLRTPILAGRPFTDEEILATVPNEVVILGESLARSLFGEADPLGRLVRFPRHRDPERIYHVVGVAGDVRFSASSLTRAADPMSYLPFGAFGQVPGNATFVVQARPGADDVARVIRSTVATLDEDVPVTGLQSYSDLVTRFYGSSVTVALLTGVMSLFAAFLAAVGLYGVVGVAAAERVHEFGIRIALGADRRAMVRLVTGEAIGVVLPGLLLGLLGAFALGIVIEGFLYGVSPLDPLSWALATLLLALVATFAVAAPVRRATRVDPIEVLRAG